MRDRVQQCEFARLASRRAWSRLAPPCDPGATWVGREPNDRHPPDLQSPVLENELLEQDPARP
jgi:hypothetical protein